MPLLQLHMLPGRTLAQKRELAETLTRETARIAKCPETAVEFIITEVSSEHWASAGKLYADKAKT